VLGDLALEARNTVTKAESSGQCIASCKNRAQGGGCRAKRGSAIRQMVTSQNHLLFTESAIQLFGSPLFGTAADSIMILILAHCSTKFVLVTQLWQEEYRPEGGVGVSTSRDRCR
jgi:hypothetical protein